MDAGDALTLARAQFGLNIGFHILFPTITIALAWYLIAFRATYARTGAASKSTRGPATPLRWRCVSACRSLWPTR